MSDNDEFVREVADLIASATYRQLLRLAEEFSRGWIFTDDPQAIAGFFDEWSHQFLSKSEEPAS